MYDIEEPTLEELLNEPIVRKVMARDRVSEVQVLAIAIAARNRIERASVVEHTAQILPFVARSAEALTAAPSMRRSL